ncbi:hypothetical protein JCM14469_30050 [Desulfatiferula olefinivorans]
MDKEFHYHITGIIARRAGFSEEDAVTIAHAAQLVDDNDFLCVIEAKDQAEPYEVYISQTMDILKPKRDLMRIYPIFHFLPGDPLAPSARRSDGKMHILTTTPGNALARKVMKAAREDRSPFRLHRLGVAAHAFADTWAHQNFVGWYDGINGQDLNLLPNIGHADFIHHPDWVAHQWNDSRIIRSQVNNTHRFLDAAKCLFDEFARCTRKKNKEAAWQALEQDLLAAMGPAYTGEKLKGEEARLERYDRLFKLPDYDPRAWFDRAVATTVKGLPDTFLPSLTVFRDHYQWKDGYLTSDFFLFQEAVKAHQAFCMVELSPLFEQMNVTLHNH